LHHHSQHEVINPTREDYLHYAIVETIRNKLRASLKVDEEKEDVLREFGLLGQAQESPNDTIVQVRDRTPAEKRVEETLLAQRRRVAGEIIDVRRIVNLRDRNEHFRLRETIIEELCTSYSRYILH
jgi:hypothetical protein